jgi:hypothetical protein
MSIDVLKTAGKGPNNDSNVLDGNNFALVSYILPVLIAHI